MASEFFSVADATTLDNRPAYVTSWCQMHFALACFMVASELLKELMQPQSPSICFFHHILVSNALLLKHPNALKKNCGHQTSLCVKEKHWPLYPNLPSQHFSNLCTCPSPRRDRRLHCSKTGVILSLAVFDFFMPV